MAKVHRTGKAVIIASIIAVSACLVLLWRRTTDCYYPLKVERNNKPSMYPSPCAVVNFSMHKISTSECGHEATSNSIDAADTDDGVVADADQDGIDDIFEDWLAERFAPIIFHGQCDPNYPVSVDWLLARTSLYEYDNSSKPAGREAARTLKQQSDLLNHSFTTKQEQTITSDSTRSVCKQSSYFLANVNDDDQAGARNHPRDWVTYVHSYHNQRGGITIQYWRCYSYNNAGFLTFDFSHGGDWEAVAVHLGATLNPETVSFLGHTGIEYHTGKVQWEGDHPKIWSEEGGHAGLVSPAGMKSKRFTRQETWSGGQVTWWDGTAAGASGGLINVGEKSRPRNGQVFVQYSGLWGSPGRWFITSGYWGPAFNETDAQCEDGRKAYKRSPTCSPGSMRCGRIFHKAWCDGMDGRLLDLNIECYGQDYSR